jgi:glycosyltransferase involved in cell wall biosynthesis
MQEKGATLVTISEHRAREMCELFDLRRDDIRVIAPPVSTGWLGIEAVAMDDARALGALRADPLVLVPSKLGYHKGLSVCPPLAGELSRRFEGSLLLISGASSPHEPLASERILEDLKAQSGQLKPGAFGIASDILGREMDGQLARAVMMLADVVFLPSVEEGYGLAIAEACALGTPVACTDIASFREAGAGWARYVSADASTAEIAQAISDLCRTPAARARRAAVRSFDGFSAALADLWPAQLKV